MTQCTVLVACLKRYSKAPPLKLAQTHHQAVQTGDLIMDQIGMIGAGFLTTDDHRLLSSPDTFTLKK